MGDYKDTVQFYSPSYYLSFDSGSFSTINEGSVTLTSGTNMFDYGGLSYPTDGIDSSNCVDMVAGANSGFSGVVITDTTAIFNDKNFTVSMWVKPDTFTTQRTLLDVWPGSTSRLRMFMPANTTSNLTIDYISTSGSNRQINASGLCAFDDGYWHHIVYRSSGGVPTLWIDGILKETGSTQTGTISIDSGQKSIGLAVGTPINPYDGKMDEIAIFTSALSDAAITELYFYGPATTYNYAEFLNSHFGSEMDLWRGETTSSSHPVTDSIGSSGTTTGTYLATSGGNAMIGNGFGFDRTTYTGWKRTPYGQIYFDDRTFSISAFIKTNGDTGYLTIVRAQATSTNLVIFRVVGTDDGTVPGVLQGYILGYTVNGSTRVDDGEWHHVGLIYDYPSRYMRVYVDGAQDGSYTLPTSSTGLSLSSSDLYVGHYDGTEIFNGYIDELMITGDATNVASMNLQTQVGFYQQNSAAININVDAAPMTASALVVDPAISVESSISIAADPITVSAEFVDPSVTTTQVDPNFVYNAGIMEATLLLTTVVVDTEQNTVISPAPLTTSALFVDPTLYVEAPYTHFAGPILITSAVVVQPTIVTDPGLSGAIESLNAVYHYRFNPGALTENDGSYTGDILNLSGSTITSGGLDKQPYWKGTATITNPSNINASTLGSSTNSWQNTTTIFMFRPDAGESSIYSSLKWENNQPFNAESFVNKGLWNILMYVRGAETYTPANAGTGSTEFWTVPVSVYLNGTLINQYVDEYQEEHQSFEFIVPEDPYEPTTTIGDSNTGIAEWAVFDYVLTSSQREYIIDAALRSMPYDDVLGVAFETQKFRFSNLSSSASNQHPIINKANNYDLWTVNNPDGDYTEDWNEQYWIGSRTGTQRIQSTSGGYAIDNVEYIVQPTSFKFDRATNTGIIIDLLGDNGQDRRSTLYSFMSFWIKMNNNVDGYPTIWQDASYKIRVRGHNEANPGQLELYFPFSSGISAVYGSDYPHTMLSNVRVDDNEWHNIVIVANKNGSISLGSTEVFRANYDLYIDNVLDKSQDIWGAANELVDFPVYIGRSNENINNHSFVGNISDILIADRIVIDPPMIDLIPSNTYISGLAVDPTSVSNAAAPIEITNGVLVNPVISTTSNVLFDADPFTMSWVLVDPTLYLEVYFEWVAEAALAEALMTETIPAGSARVPGGRMEASAEMVDPTLQFTQDATILATPLIADAFMNDADVLIVVNADPMEANAEFLDVAFIETVSNTGYQAQTMTAAVALAFDIGGTAEYDAEDLYYEKINEIGAEIHIRKLADGWKEFNPNSIFGFTTIRPSTGAPTTETVYSANGTKFAGTFDGTDFFHFYPHADKYPPVGISQSVIDDNPDFNYTVTTGPWYYVTTEESYEIVLNTTNGNQKLLYGLSTYVNNQGTSSAADDTLVTTKIEYGLENGKLYMLYYADIASGAAPVKIIGNTNIADGQDHHIVLQRTPADGNFRKQYVLGLAITEATTSPYTPTRTADTVIEHQYYADPVTGNIFHGFEIWVDGELDQRSTEFNSTMIAPLVRGITETRIVTTQDPNTGIISYSREAKETGFVGNITSFVGRFNTQSLNYLLSYRNSAAERFPSEAKVLQHAALDPQTIYELSQAALFQSIFADADVMETTAEMVDPVVLTNVKNILRIYWNAQNAVGQNFGVSTDGVKYQIDTYSATQQLSNNPTHVFNYDAAVRDGATDPSVYSDPEVVDYWRYETNLRPRLLNIFTDLDLDRYNTIVFMDYPDDGPEFDNLLPTANVDYITQEYELFLARLKNAITIHGKSLFVSSPRLAADLKIIAKETKIAQNYDCGCQYAQGVDPFPKPSGTGHYLDNNRFNRYEIVNLQAGITDVPSWIIKDAISYEYQLADEYHIRYENKANGLSIGDQMLIPSLPITFGQLNRDVAGYTDNRRSNFVSGFMLDDVLTGKPLAKIQYTDVYTTLVLRPGDLLDGSRITGKIFVNFAEDALTMGVEEYNYGIIQTGFSAGSVNENASTINWQYSTSRTTRQLNTTNNVIVNAGIFGQTWPTDGGGGPVVQAPSSSTFGNIRLAYDEGNESFTSSLYFAENSEKYPTNKIFVASMTLRGLEWLHSYEIDGTNVGVEEASASLVLKDPIINANGVPQPESVSISATPMTAAGVLIRGLEDMFRDSQIIQLAINNPQIITLTVKEES